MKFVVGTVAVFLYGNLCLAGPSPHVEAELPIGDLLALALKNSDTLRADEQDQKQWGHLYDNSSMLQNPSLALTGGKIRGSEAAGPILEATLSQTFPFPGKLSAKQRVAEATGKQIRAQGQQRRLALEHQVVLLCYQIAVIDRLAHHILERKQRIGLIRAFLAGRPFVSPVQTVDRDLVENKVRLLEKVLIELQSQKVATWNELNFHLRLAEPILPRVHWWVKPTIPDPGFSDPSAKQNSPALVNQLLIADRAEAELEVGRSNYLPDINLGVGYRQEGSGADVTQFYSAYLTFNLPLIDHGQHLVPALDASRQAERLRAEHQRRIADSSLVAKIEEVKKNSQGLALFPLTLLKESEATFERAEAEFRRGRLPITAFLEMENQTHETQDMIFQTQVNYTRALSGLLLHFGRAMEIGGESDVVENR